MGETGNILAIINLVVTSLLTVAVYYVASKTRQIDRLQERVEAAAQAAVEHRFNALRGECAMRHQSADAQIEAIRERLSDGDHSLETLSMGEQEIRLKLVSDVAGLKDFVRVQCASREDLRRLEDQIDGLRQQIGREMLALRGLASGVQQ
jgi:hypothetical protein